MDPLPALEEPPFPEPAADGSVTLTKESVAKLFVMLGGIRTYLQTQLERCAVP